MNDYANREWMDPHWRARRAVRSLVEIVFAFLLVAVALYL